MKTLKLLIVKHWLVVDGGGGHRHRYFAAYDEGTFNFSSSHNSCAVLTTMQVRKNLLFVRGKIRAGELYTCSKALWIR